MNNQPKIAPVSAVPQPKWKLHMTILVVINLVVVIGIFFLANQITSAGQELKKLRTEKLAVESSATGEVATQELINTRESYQKVLDAFPNETKVLDFVTSMDQLRRQGLISQFSFASDIPLKDKNGILGLPILIELTGSQDQISSGLRAIEELPVILNSIRIEVSTSADNVRTMRYGGFLYVDQNFSQD